MTHGLRRFARYLVVGVSTFILDLGMLYLAVSWAHVPLYIATPASFLIAVSCNYVLSRLHVFAGTERGWYGGYAYFAVVAACAALITTGLVAVLVSLAGLNYLLARVIVGTLVGIGGYFFNLHITFRMGRQPN